MSCVSHVPYISSVDGAEGYRLTMPVPKYVGNGDANVVVVGSPAHGNRICVEAFGEEINEDLCLEAKTRASEELEEIALRYLSENRFDEAFSAWADNVLATSEELWSQFQKNEFRETELYVGDDFFCVVAPCYEVGKKAINKADVEYYLVVGDSEISGGKSIYDLANQYVNKDLLHESRINEQNELQRFYDENIYPIRNTPPAKLTAEQKRLNTLYVNWHNDLYGYPPHSKSQDVCFQNHNNSSRKDVLRDTI